MNQEMVVKYSDVISIVLNGLTLRFEHLKKLERQLEELEEIVELSPELLQRYELTLMDRDRLMQMSLEEVISVLLWIKTQERGEFEITPEINSLSDGSCFTSIGSIELVTPSAEADHE